MPATKDIIRVWEAAQSGVNTSNDIAEMTGLSVAEVSVWVGELIALGWLRHTGRTLRYSPYGRPSLCFEITALTRP